MSKEILYVAETVANEKAVPQELIFKAIESALVMATKKLYGVDHNYVVEVDRRTGDYETYRCWQVVDIEEDGLENAEVELSLEQAKEKDPQAEVGGVVKQKVESIEFGRIAAQTAKQVIVQELRKAERHQVVEAYTSRKGSLVNGVARRVTRDGVFVDLGNNVEAYLARTEMIPKEIFRVGDRVRAYLMDVRFEPRGAQLFLSRTSSEMLTQLFRIEVPEIAEDIIQIMGAARDPGIRAKILVKTNDGRIDPIGACVGMRGARVQAVSSELHGEKIDIVLWSDNPAQLVINAMAPAEILSIVVDEDTHTMDLAVAEEQVAQAIGRTGQNVRLASELTGWQINVMSAAELEAKRNKEAVSLRENLLQQLDIDPEIADILLREGFASVEDIAYVPAEEMLQVEEFDEEIVDALRQRAKDYLLTKAITEEAEHQPAADLLALEGMTEELAKSLASQGIKTREDLAEQSVADLLDVIEIPEEEAAKLILAARAHWFE